MDKNKLVTGIQPTNNLHIGNLFGAINNFHHQIQQNTEQYVFAADLHTLTTTRSSKETCYDLFKLIITICGSHNIQYYLQSDLSEELGIMTWFLSCKTPMGLLSRMTQYKDKKDQYPNVGLFTYPILMAADILSVGATHVPVGIDQKQHIEFTRDMAESINNASTTGQIFTLPTPIISPEMKILDLQTGKKMSKSSSNTMGTIFLMDSPDIIRQKIQRATTDSFPMPTDIKAIEKSRPFIYNLCNVAAAMGTNFATIQQQFGEQNIVAFKRYLTDQMINYLTPIQEAVMSISNREIDHLLDLNRPKVKAEMCQTLKQLKTVFFY